MAEVRVIENVFRSGYDLSDLKWVEWVQPGRVAVDNYPLWVPDGDEQSGAFLARYPAGAHGDFHEHLGFELMLVLDGTIDHSDGRSFVKGDLIVESPGTRHQMSTVAGCTILAIRTRPTAAREAVEGEVADLRLGMYQDQDR